MILRLLLCIILMCSSTHSLAEEIIKSHGHAVFGDLKYPKNFEHFDFVNPDAPKGGQVNLYSLGTFDSLNSFILKGNSAPSLSLTFDSLMTNSLDEPYSSYGLIAESISYPKSREWVEYKIRDEARWHDGTPITAYDVKFTMELLKEKGDPNYKIIYREIEPMEITDYKVIRFKLKSPENPSLIAYIGGMNILPKHFLDGKEFDKFDSEPIMGSGPYKIKRFEFGKYIEYERVHDYWAKDLNVNRGVYNFDQVRFDAYYDPQIAIEAFKGGAYDFRQENISRAFATSYDIDAVHDGRIIKEVRAHKLPANLQTTFINMRRPLLQDRNLRFAINQAFDFDWMNKALFYDTYKRTDSYFDNTYFAASGLPSEKELKILEKFKDSLPPEVFTTEYEQPTTGADPLQNRENLTLALNRLLQNGYKMQGDVLMSPITNQPVIIEIMYFTPQFERVFNALKANLANIGIKLNLRFLDQAQYMKRMQDFDFDLATMAFGPVTIPGDNQIQLWHSKSDVTGGLNFSGIHDPAVDYILEGLKNADTQEEMMTYTHALDRVLLWNYYTILQLHSNKFRMLYWNKFGMPETRPHYDVGLYTWWIK